MDVSVLEAVTVVDVLLLLLSVVLAFTLYQCALSIDDRVARTTELSRATWFGLGLVLLAGGVWILGLATTVPFRAPGPVGYRVLPALLSAALALAATAFGLVVLQLDLPRWMRAVAATVLWGASVPVILYLDVSGIGWRGIVHSDPVFTLQVLLAALAGAALIVWSLLASREAAPRAKWWRIAAAMVGTLTAPAAVYVAFIETRGGAEPAGPESGLRFLLDPVGLLIAGVVLLAALGGVLLAASLDRRLRMRREETEALRHLRHRRDT